MKILRKRDFFLFLSLYVTQFLGLGFFTEAFIAILRKTGMSLENLGIVYMLGFFWVLRFVWAPFIDKVNFQRIGHYRFWLILSQIIMVSSLFFASFYEVTTHISIILLCAVIFSFFSATQDIALDALVYKTLTKEQRPFGNAIKVSGGLLGSVLGGGVALIIYSYLQWQTTVLILASFTSIAIIQLLLFKEPTWERKAKQKRFVFKEFYSFWKGKNRKIWLIFILLFPCAVATAHGLISPILVDLGWELKDIGLIVHIIGYSIGIVASFGASWLINKFGKKRVLIFCSIGQIIGLFFLILLLHGYSSTTHVILTIGTIFIFYTPSTTVISTLMMDEIDSNNPASQYAIQHSMFMLSGLIFASMSIFFSGKFGYENIVLAICLIAFIPLILSFKIDSFLSKEEKEKIETNSLNTIG